MKRMTTGWKRARALLLPGMFLAALPASSCADAVEEACGPCGKVSTGDYSVSGNAELDGFFQAVGTFHGAAATVTSQFQADLGEIAALYSIEAKADGTWCAVGSVNSMVGHPKAAAVAAGLITAALALYNNVLPPTLNVVTLEEFFAIFDAYETGQLR